MKLIYITNSRIPTEKAHGIQIMKMCESFSDLDYGKENVEVELVVPNRFNTIQEDAFDYYEVEQNFKIKKLPCIDLMPLAANLPFRNFFEKTAFFIRVLTFHFSSLFYVSFKRKDIIYTRDKFFLFYTLLSKNVVYEAHTFPETYSLYLPFFKRARKIIVITEKLKDYFVEKRIEGENIFVAPDGVDIEKFDVPYSKSEARKKLDLPRDKKIVLYTGHLYKWKGVYCLAGASKYLPEDVDIYFVGGTKEDIETFQRKTPDLRINITGHRPHSDIPYWLKAADVLVLPNSGKRDISKYWTSPIKMFEYMASKTPIVASNLPSIREVLNEKNAVLVESDNPKMLAEGIRMLLQDIEFSDKISNQAFEDVSEYDWRVRATNIIYKSTLRY